VENELDDYATGQLTRFGPMILVYFRSWYKNKQLYMGDVIHLTYPAILHYAATCMPILK